MLQRCDEHMHSWINDSIKQDQPDDDVKEKRLGVRRQSEAELWICFVDSHCNLRNQSKAASREAGTRNEPALAGGILVAPGVSPGFTDPKNQEAPAGRQKDAGTNLCRPLRSLSGKRVRRLLRKTFGPHLPSNEFFDRVEWFLYSQFSLFLIFPTDPKRAGLITLRGSRVNAAGVRYERDAIYDALHQHSTRD